MKIIVKGNIGADAILRTVGEGENQFSVLDFNVAENKTNGDGSKKTIWTKVTLWRAYAEKMAQYLKKGRYVQVEGEGEVETYVTNGNQIAGRVHINRNVSIDLGFDRPAQPEDAPWAETAELEEV
jgi:single stranded DNA-binding protein